MHSESIDLMQYFIDNYLKDGPSVSVLDVGSQDINGSYRSLFEPMHKYTGMDIVPGNNVDIVGHENVTEVYDVVISGQTMEHVNHPWDWLKQIKQYSKKYICIIAPWSFHEHRYPIDTYRYFPDGMKDLFNYAAIKPLEIFKRTNSTIGIGTI